MRSIFLVGMAAAAAACVEPGVDDLGVTEQAIMDGDPATPFQWVRAAKLPNCSGTVVAPRFVLTALHCIEDLIPHHHTVETYSTWQYSDDDSAITIVGFRQPPGTRLVPDDVGPDDFLDEDDVFADFALVVLAEPTDATIATMAWSYPGPDRTVVKVGSGMHENAGNGIGTLLQRTDMTTAASDASGKIPSTSVNINHGDSGGPLYHNGRVLGVLHAGYHTSVPRHLNFILREIGYIWAGDPPAQRYRTGSLLANLEDVKERHCQYACERHSACVAYNYYTAIDRCHLLASVTGTHVVAGWRSATK